MTITSTPGGDPVENARDDSGESGETMKCHRFPICGNLVSWPRRLCEMCQMAIDDKVDAEGNQ